jgi:hypothetical protein
MKLNAKQRLLDTMPSTDESLTEFELTAMCNAVGPETGLGSVVVWVGPTDNQHGPRVKVSNIPNTITSKDCFSITLPDLEVIGEVLISKKKLKEVFKFVELNMELLMEADTKGRSDNHMPSSELLRRLKKI